MGPVDRQSVYEYVGFVEILNCLFVESIKIVCVGVVLLLEIRICQVLRK